MKVRLGVRLGVSDEVFDPEFGGQFLDPSKVSAEDIEAMQQAVEDQLKSVLGPVADALDAIKAAEDAVLPDIIKEALDKLEDELAGLVEAAAGDEIRESVRTLEIPELL